MSAKVLVVDDDLRLRTLVKEYLEGYGFAVVLRPDGNDIARALARENPDMVILDVMMPGKDGLAVLRDLRAVSTVPVIMLTAKGEDADRIVGLEMGADDYLPKPFNPRELLARIRAVLRREAGAALAAAPEEPREVRVGRLRLDMERRLLGFGDQEMELSATEFKLMEALMTRPQVVFTRDQLLGLARGRDSAPFERSVDVHVSNLRAKLKGLGLDGGIIATVWGVGYKLMEEA